MNLDPVTSRWVGAFFNLAKRSNALAEVEHDVLALDQAFASAKVQAYFFGGTASTADKRNKLQPLLKDFHPLTMKFVQLLLDRGRVGVLRQAGVAFKRRQLAERGAVEGVVESVRPLPDAEIAELARSLGTRLAKEVLLENRLNPELVGGVRVFVDAKMIDYSVQGRLQGLRRKMMEAELPTPA
ncbi:MAG: F-type H+-transporting ATPase subunit delta [Chlamydiales bacterium]